MTDVGTTQPVTRPLAEFASAVTFEELPGDVVHQAVRLIIDTLACAVAGADTRSAQLVRQVLAGGGAPEAVAIGQPGRTGMREAAFVNAVAAKARDFDDYLLHFSHLANTVVTCAVAVAEREEADGRALIAAVVAGYEVVARMALAMPGSPGIIDGGTDAERIGWTVGFSHSYNVIGGAVAAAHLLGLDAHGMAQTIGIAAYSAPVPSGTKLVLTHDRMPLMKAGMYGWQAWSGCLAAELAAAGLTGDDTALDGPYGFWTMMGAGYFHEDQALYGLGEHWWIRETSFKLVPAGTWMRPAIDAVEQIRVQDSFDQDRIDRIEVHTRLLINHGSMITSDPKSYIDAQFSYVYLVAVAALGFAPETWQDRATFDNTRVRELLARTSLHPHAGAEAELKAQLKEPPYRARGVYTLVRVVLDDGSVLEADTRYGDGDPFDPRTAITDEKVNEKFERFAAPHMTGVDTKEVLQACWNLEHGEPTRSMMDTFLGVAGHEPD